MGFLIKIGLIVIILCAMILILLGVREFVKGDHYVTSEDAERLRHDIRHKHSVITKHSVFNGFLSKNLKNHPQEDHIHQ